MKKMLLRLFYYFISLYVGRGSFLYALMVLEDRVGGYLPWSYTVMDRYFIFCDWIDSIISGENYSYRYLENKYFEKFKIK